MRAWLVFSTPLSFHVIVFFLRLSFRVSFLSSLFLLFVGLVLRGGALVGFLVAFLLFSSFVSALFVHGC